jgi:hypothetical protein
MNLNNKGFVRIFEASIAGIMLILVFGYLISSHNVGHATNLNFYGYNALYNLDLEKEDFEMGNVDNIYSKLSIPNRIDYGIEIYKNKALYYSDVNGDGEVAYRTYVFENNGTVDIYTIKLVMWWRQ